MAVPQSKLKFIGKNRRGPWRHEYRPGNGALAVQVKFPGRFQSEDVERWRGIAEIIGALAWRIRHRHQVEHLDARGGPSSGHTVSGGMWRSLRVRVGGTTRYTDRVTIDVAGKSAKSWQWRRRDGSYGKRIHPEEKVLNRIKAYASSNGDNRGIFDPSSSEVDAVGSGVLAAITARAIAGMAGEGGPPGVHGDSLLSQAINRVIARAASGRTTIPD